MTREPTHEIRIPENDRCTCHDQPCTWHADSETWTHPDGTLVDLDNWPWGNELHMVATDEPPYDDDYPPRSGGSGVVLGDGAHMRGTIEDGTTGDPEDDYYFAHEEWFVAVDACLAVKVEDIPPEWLHELPKETKP